MDRNYVQILSDFHNSNSHSVGKKAVLKRDPPSHLEVRKNSETVSLESMGDQSAERNIDKREHAI